MLKCDIFANFLDFENDCYYLNTIACKRTKHTPVSYIFYLKKHYFIDLNT